MEKTYNVEGMKCDGCVDIVTEKLGALPNVSKVTVSLADKTAKVECSGALDIAALNEALSDTKFKIVSEV